VTIVRLLEFAIITYSTYPIYLSKGLMPLILW